MTSNYYNITVSIYTKYTKKTLRHSTDRSGMNYPTIFTVQV